MINVQTEPAVAGVECMSGRAKLFLVSCIVVSHVTSRRVISGKHSSASQHTEALVSPNDRPEWLLVKSVLERWLESPVDFWQFAMVLPKEREGAVA